MRLIGRGRRACVFSQLAVDEIGQARREPVQLTIEPADPKPLLPPEHIGGKYTERDDKRQRVPERHARTERQPRHGVGSAVSW